MIPLRLRGFALGAALAGVAVSDACMRRKPEPVAPAATPDPVALAWTTTYDDARVAIAASRYVHAESVLTIFRERYVAAPQSADALYWRAIARVGLVTTSGGVRSVLADLDSYRASGASDHLAEVTAIGRGLAQLDSARAVPVVVGERSAITASRMVLISRDSLRARDDDLARYRADATAARAELDRIRRRLAAPGRRP